ncbi:MAG: YgfZ/GcvT domain-containing protein [Methanococcaceae archaeon]
MPVMEMKILQNIELFKSLYENIVLDESGSQVKIYDSIPDEYHSLSHGVGMRDISGAGIIELFGKESLDFLHRLSTNDLKNLEKDYARGTIFTNEKGRIIDRALVVNFGEKQLLLSSRVFKNKLLSWLNKYIIMEDIRTADAIGRYSVLEFIGPQTESFLSFIFGKEIDYLGFDTLKYIEIERVRFNLLKIKEGNQIKIIIISHAAESEFLIKYMFEQNNIFDFRPVGEHAYSLFRIMKAIPAAPGEINDKYNPIETGLLSDISFKKGCYIGQEVIARLDTYDKVQRYLKAITFEDFADIQDEVILQSGDIQVGEVTSCAKLPGRNKTVGLAYIKKEFAEEGSRLIAIDKEGKTYQVIVSNMHI